MPLWPADAFAWRVLHSHYVDAVAARSGAPLDLLGFLTALAAGEVGVVGTVTADGLAYVVTRAGVPLCRVPAADLGLAERVVAGETARVELMRAIGEVPDDLSGLPL